MILAGDFRLITMMKYAINMDNIKVYLIKNTSENVFLWVIGKILDEDKINMYPLLKEQSKELQLEIQKILVENCLLKEAKEKVD